MPARLPRWSRFIACAALLQKDGKMISRYGARIMEIGSRLYLVAATPNELATAMAQDPTLARGRDMATIEHDSFNSVRGDHSALAPARAEQNGAAIGAGERCNSS
jgi:hypothetical protein